jgi:hypothetical protein
VYVCVVLSPGLHNQCENSHKRRAAAKRNSFGEAAGLEGCVWVIGGGSKLPTEL